MAVMKTTGLRVLPRLPEGGHLKDELGRGMFWKTAVVEKAFQIEGNMSKE